MQCFKTFFQITLVFFLFMCPIFSFIHFLSTQTQVDLVKSFLTSIKMSQNLASIQPITSPRNDASREQCRGPPMSGGSHRAGLVVSKKERKKTIQGASLRACQLSRDFSVSSRFTFIGKDRQQPPPPRAHFADPNSAKGAQETIHREAGELLQGTHSLIQAR